MPIHLELVTHGWSQQVLLWGPAQDHCSVSFPEKQPALEGSWDVLLAPARELCCRGRDEQAAAPESSCTARAAPLPAATAPHLLETGWAAHRCALKVNAVKAGVQSTTSHCFSFPLAEGSALAQQLHHFGSPQ